MATHSSTLAWKILWMEEPGRLPSMGSLRVGHDWATSLSHFTFMYWRRTRQPTPVFLPGESQGQRNLMGCTEEPAGLSVGSHRVGHDWSDLAAAAAAAAAAAVYLKWKDYHCTYFLCVFQLQVVRNNFLFAFSPKWKFFRFFYLIILKKVQILFSWDNHCQLFCVYFSC